MCDCEGHALTKEERKVCEAGDGNVSAGSTRDAYPSVEVKDELGKIAGQYRSFINDHQELTSRSLSMLKRAAVVVAASNWAMIVATLAGSAT